MDAPDRERQVRAGGDDRAAVAEREPAARCDQAPEGGRTLARRSSGAPVVALPAAGVSCVVVVPDLTEIDVSPFDPYKSD